jgi:hypothetical protein
MTMPLLPILQCHGRCIGCNLVSISFTPFVDLFIYFYIISLHTCLYVYLPVCLPASFTVVCHYYLYLSLTYISLALSHFTGVTSVVVDKPLDSGFFLSSASIIIGMPN